MPDLAAALAGDGLDRPLESGAAEAASFLGDGFFVVAELLLAGFFLAVGLAAVQGAGAARLARLDRVPARDRGADTADRLGGRRLRVPDLGAAGV